MPKGGWEPSDKVLENAALREAWEEGRAPPCLFRVRPPDVTLPLPPAPALPRHVLPPPAPAHTRTPARTHTHAHVRLPAPPCPPDRTTWSPAECLVWARVTQGEDADLSALDGRILDPAEPVGWEGRRLGAAFLGALLASKEAAASARGIDIEAAPLERLAADLLQVAITPSSRMRGVEVGELRLPVVMLTRPQPPEGAAGSVPEALSWLADILGRRTCE